MTIYQTIRDEIYISFTAEKASNRNLIPDNVVEGGISKPVILRDKKGVIIGQRECINIVASRARGVSTCPVHDDAFAHARVVRAVNQLPEYHNALMMYCYTDKKTDWQLITLVSEYVWERMEIFIEGWQRFQCKKLRVKKVQKIKALTFNALLHFRADKGQSKKLYTIEQLASLMAISDANWRRDWRHFWNQLLSILGNLDEQALILVDRNSRIKSVA